MARGGAREGAGRPEGTANKRTREIADKAAAEGLTPLEVMLDNMAFYHREADELLERLVVELAAAGEAVATSGEDAEVKAAGADTARTAAIEVLRNILGLRKMAGEEAARAAPYMHSRLNAIDDKGDTANDVVPLAERLKAYAKAEAIEASGGKVVALK